MATTTVSHSSIGSVKASTAKQDVLQFLGLQYATISDRFAPAIMKEYAPDSTVDATRLGPQVLSIAPGPDAEFGLIQHTLEFDRSQLSMSDTEGLCLNITVPASQSGSLDTERKLPVLVFIHGGGFMVGSGTWPQYDMARIVQLSIKEGMPCIGVTINYRLGSSGLLTSKALQAAGYKPNNALRDQRTALLWLRNHIPGFGGDADNITLMGESAGAISVCYQLFSKEPLFKRMMPMSGTQLLMAPISLEQAEKNYQRAIKALELADDESAVKALLSMNGPETEMKLLQAGVSCAPVLDDDLCPTSFDFASIMDKKTEIPGRKWCEEAMIGDCQFDGNIEGLRLIHRKQNVGAEFCSAISKGLSDKPEIAERLLSAYGLTPDTADEEAFFKVLQAVNDMNFYVPSLALANNVSEHMKTYVYRFNELNPWDGQWKGHATHILDIAFLLQNFNDFLDAPQKQLAEQFAADVIRFANGREPWGRWTGRDNTTVAKVYGPEGKTEVVEDVPDKVGRKRTILDLGGEVGFDTLKRAFETFSRPAPPPV